MAEANNNKKEQENSKATEPANGTATAPAGEPKEPRQPVQVSISDIELEKIKAEAAEYKDKYLRLLAESENARKRLQKERQELIQYAVQNVILDFLNPIDHMENALKFTQQMSPEVKSWAVGFQMILTQFKDVLANNGVIPFVSEGTEFDPHRHEAVEMIATSNFPPGVVVEESVRGYKIGDRTLRPARVKVSKAVAAAPAPKTEENKEENK
jgi:molecular chaperone GrpE